MPLKNKIYDQVPRGGRPVIGMIAGFQMYSMGTPYSYLDLLTRGVQAGAKDRGCSLLLACGLNLVDPPNQRPAWPIVSLHNDFVPVGPWNVDGLLVVPPLLSPERSSYIQHLKATEFPIVHIGSAEGGPAIGVDNETGIREAMVHLARHGHRRVAFLRGYPEDEDGDSGARYRAYEGAARELGMELDPRLVEYGYHDTAMSHQAVNRILASGAPFTAVLASNDDSAYAAVDALKLAGLRVPADVAVIGFDDFPQSASKTPPLTSVRHPVFERGYEAVALLLEYIEGVRTSRDVVQRLPTELMIRRSCGCAAERAPEAIANVDVPEPASDVRRLEAQLIRISSQTLVNEAAHMSVSESDQLSERLIRSLVASLRSVASKDFLRTLQALLAHVEHAKGDVWSWRQVMDVLGKEKAAVDLAGNFSDGEARLRQLLAQGCACVDDSARRCHMLQFHFESEEHGRMIARLHVALDEAQILKVLREHFSALGLAHADIAMVEAEGDDPIAWSVMGTIENPDAAPIRFPTREFPFSCYALPEGRFSFMLVPLVIQQERFGYMVFDANDLDLCGTAAHTVNAALAAANMYREAVEGRRAAEEANNLKSRFVSTVSHELRTPLSIIRSASDLLVKSAAQFPGDDSLRQNLSYIQAATHHLDGLIGDVLDLTLDEVGRLKLIYEPVDLSAVLEPVVVSGESLAKSKNLTWLVDIPGALPKVWADRARLRQIMLNLITNAVKFTERGGVLLRVETSERDVTISVHDSGVGIPPEDCENIFDDFAQSRFTANKGYGGLGLGLAICKRLVQMHGGSIRVESAGEKNSGSKFL